MAKQANAIELLRKDHREVKMMFDKFENASDQEQDELCRQMVDALKMHARIEEEVFYPFIQEATDRLDLVEEANVEHATAKQLLAELESGQNGVHRDAVVKVLSEYVGHHIQEEEEKIFPLVEKMGIDLDALGEELLDHREGRSGMIDARPEDGSAKRPRRAKARGRSHGNGGSHVPQAEPVDGGAQLDEEPMPHEQEEQEARPR